MWTGSKRYRPHTVQGKKGSSVLDQILRDFGFVLKVSDNRKSVVKFMIANKMADGRHIAF